MLVTAAVLDQHHVAGLPFHVAPVMDVMAVALEHVKHRPVEVAVLLSGIERRLAFDVRLDRLHDVDRLRRDDVLAVHRRSPLPGMVLGGIDPRLFQKLFVEVAVGAFQRPHEGALLGPAVPFAVLDLVGVFRRRLVVAESGRFMFQHSGHSSLLSVGHYEISPMRAMSQPTDATLVAQTGHARIGASSKGESVMRWNTALMLRWVGAAVAAMAAFAALDVPAAQAQSAAGFYAGKS